MVHEITRTALKDLLIEGNLKPYSTLDELDKFELRDDARWLVVTGSVEFPDYHGCTYLDVRVYCCSNNEEFAVWLAERDAAWYLEHPGICVREFEVWHVVDDDAAVGAFRMDRAVSDAQPLHYVKIRKSAFSGYITLLTSNTHLVEEIWDRYNEDWSLFTGYSTEYDLEYLVIPKRLWNECGQTVEGLLA